MLTKNVPVILAALVCLSSCGRPERPAPPPSPKTILESVRAALETRVGPEGSNGPVYCRRDRICGSEVLPGFYRARDLRPAWIDEGLALANARAFLGALRQVAEDGLDPDNYHLSVLETLLAEIDAARKTEPRHVPPETLADLEMLLTDAFLLCGSHLVHGQVNPETVQSEWFIKGRVEDLAAVLDKGLAANDIPGALDSLRPDHPVYRGLKTALRDQKAEAENGGWPPFPPGPKLVKKDRDARVVALRMTLAAMGELADAPEASGDPSLFDERLEQGVKAFQRRHGLDSDGVVGAGTAAALALPAPERVRQLRANLERWRWIDPNLGERYIIVNIADFRVRLVEAGRDVLSMPAIVGTYFRRTPEFSGKMTYIELNPAWSVPPKLAREDILPKARKDPGYLKKKGFRVFENWSAEARELDPDTIDWSRIDPDRLSYRFRQDPGPQNSLGRVKFMFPNKHDVYLHDTPDRWLFTLAARNLSSGCIRVERPVDLAENILRDDPLWTREKIVEVLKSRETQVILLRNPLSVHLLYWTAWLGEDGRAQFREDIYLRDEALYRALEERVQASGR